MRESNSVSITLVRLGLVFGSCLAVTWICPGNVVGQINRPNMPTPNRRFVMEGQVSLPDNRPAQRVRVRISNSGGTTIDAMTNDNGRFEVSDLPPGTYSVSARSVVDDSLVSDPVQTDTSGTATGTLYVNLALRSDKPTAAVKAPSGVISVAEAEQVVPKDARKLFEQALKLRSEKQNDEALTKFNQAIEKFPAYFQALAQRGDLFIALHRLPEAHADFQRALTLNGAYEPALRGAGYYNLENKDFAKAADYFEHALLMQPENLSTLVMLGIAASELDRRELAMKSLQHALSIDAARAVRAHIYLANLYARAQEYQKAATELDVYLQAVPFDPEIIELRKVQDEWLAHAKQK